MTTRTLPLRSWRKRVNTPVRQLAAEMGVTVQAWYDWEKGHRVPSRELMPRLVKITQGAVQPNDFYALPDMGQAA